MKPYLKRILIGSGNPWYCLQCDCLNMGGRWYCGNCGKKYEG